MVQPPPAVAAPRFRPSSQADLAQSGERRRIRNNLAVLRTLRTLAEEQRPAAADEQTMLARWSGWGAVPKVFDERSTGLATERAELMELLTTEEYQAAKATTLNAHYTDADLVQGIWSGLRGLGFEGGNVLEPGCGSGNFLGFAPTDTTTPTRMIGVEVDPTSAAIARHLYPDAQILDESFAETIAPEGAFDSVIGNVPFGNFALYDPRYNNTRESIHNHFIAKSLAMTKPGGMVAVITSRFTLDAENAEFRNRLASMADLVGAVRLPIDAHAAAAGTRTVTDVLFLRRHEQDHTPAQVDWNERAQLPGPDVVHVNRYFLDHPEHVVGTLGTRTGRYGAEVTVTAPWDVPTAKRFGEAVQSITQSARARGLTIPLPDADWEPLELVGGRDASREGLMEVDDNDRLTRIIDGVRVEIDPPVQKSAPELFSLLRIRDAYLELVEAERTRPVGDEHIEVLRAQLNEHYDTYTGRYGPINRFGYKSNGQRNPPRLGGLRQDLMAARVLALEKFDPTTQQATKVEIFHRRTITPAEPPETVETAADALAVSLDTYAEVRLGQIQRLMGDISAEQARRELGTLVYTEPVTEDLIPAAVYLSGDVRAKLRAAEAAARTDERFAPNVEALREVVPADLSPAEIEARLGATWISDEHVQQFAREILADEKVSVHNAGGSLWTVSGGNPTSVRASNTWGTERMPAQVILQNLLQNKAIRVTRVEVVENRERTVLDQEATDAAQIKAEEMVEEFASWAWADPTRARDLARIYNDRFNCLALCTYTGDHLTLPGLAEAFTPYPHQRAAIARALNEQNTLFAHGVGAGKTAEMVISIMEMRRLGQARKPAMVVPNHMLEQISREFAQLYPQAKILVADKDMMSRTYRARFADVAASGDWDVIVFGHNQFKNLPLPNEERRAYEDRQVAEFEDWIASAEDDPDVPERTVKQLERAKIQMQNRYKKLWAHVDAGSATLADCGIDAIVYDEAHEAKNALVRSNIQDAAKSDPSWQAEDLMMKADYIRRQGGKLIFATATPIANSVSEAYVVTRFLRPDLLHAAGIHDFDQWASTFGEIITEFEMKPEGGGFQQKDRFARFMNVPELLRAFHTFADVKLSSELGLDLPDLVRPGDPEDNTRPWVEGRQTVVVPPSRELLEYMEDLGERAGDIRRGKPQDRWSDAQQRERPDNMLWVSSDGRAAATDLRLVGEQAADQTKMAHVADQVAQIWAEHQDDVYTDPDTDDPEQRTGSLQMVFCDLGTPSTDPTRYDAYADLRERLVTQGVPREQIRFVHEAKNDKEKADLFASARDGRTQVIIGSTKKMGTGTNMQRRAVALHHVDCPWRPVDIEQREGRLVRQGNANTRVRILSYVTEGSFDSYMWQTALRKLRFIEQIMRGTLNAREVEDVSSTAMSYAEVQALASGNPLMLEKVVVEKRVKKLERAFRSHHQGQAMLERTIESAQREITNATAAVAVFDRALERRVPTKGEAFRMTVNGKSYDKRTDAADALRTCLGQHLREVSSGRAREYTPINVGALGGFNLSAQYYYGLGNTLITELILDCPSNERYQYGVTPTRAHTLYKDELATSSGHGLVMTLENTLNRVEDQRAETIEVVPRLEAEIEHARANLGAPFERLEELQQALAEEAELLENLDLPARENHVLLEGAQPAQSQVDAADAVAHDAVQAAAAPPRPSPSSVTEPEMEVAEATVVPSALLDQPSSDWRDQPTAEEVLAAAEQESQPTPAQPSRPAEASPDPAPTPAAAAAPTPESAAPPASDPPESQPAAPVDPIDQEQEAEPVQPTPEPQAAAPPSAVTVEELREAAGASVGLLMWEDDQRAETREELRTQINGALEELLERGEFSAVSGLVRSANHLDPDHVLSRESYRSRADIEDPAARAVLASTRPVRIEDDFTPGGTGVIRHISDRRRFVLREVLIRQGFELYSNSDEALLPNGDPDQRREAWGVVLAEMERVEQLVGSRYERLFEAQWQDLLAREPHDAEAEPVLIVEEPPAEFEPEPAPQAETQPPVVEEPGTTPAEPDPPPTTEPSTTPAAEQEPPRPDPVEDVEAEDLPPAPQDPLQASDGPDQQARTALRRLNTGFDPAALHQNRATVQEGIDYLIDADMSDAALDLIHQANRVDPAGAWGREPQRGQLMWQGPEGEERALTGPVLRIDHDGQHQTVVRGTSKDDEQVRALLKGLKFAWSRRQGFWYLQRRLNAPEQARRVSRLLTRLDELGRDRITETHWSDLNLRVREREREASEQAIGQLRPGVEDFIQTMQQEHRYREGITYLDAIHRGLREQGHVVLGDAPGTGDRMPFAEQRTELVTQGRDLTRQLLERFNTLMKAPEPERDLAAAWTLYEEMRVIAPPMDITDDQLDHTRRALAAQFRAAGLTPPDEEAETPVEQEQQEPAPVVDAAGMEGPPQTSEQTSDAPEATPSAAEEPADPPKETTQPTSEDLPEPEEQPQVDESSTAPPQERPEPTHETVSASEASETLAPGTREVLALLRDNIEYAQEHGTYRSILNNIRTIHQAMADSPNWTEPLPFEEEVQQLVTQGRDLTRQLLERFNAIMASPNPDLRQALELARSLDQAALPEDLSTADLDAMVEAVYTRLDQAQVPPHQDTVDQVAQETAPTPPRPDTETAPEEPAETPTPAAQQAPAPDRIIEENAPPIPDPYEQTPEDLYEEGPGDPYDDTSERAVSQLRASIDISGVDPYQERAAAERATWWIARNGVDRWENTVTAAEMAASQELPEDDVVALDHALHEVRATPLDGGAGASAVRYADLGGAAQAVVERISGDRLHLAHAASLAAEHAARLHATREYNLARMQGAHPAQLARLEARQEVARYTGADEAQEMSQAVRTVVGRWAHTATSRQVRHSSAQGMDVARVRHMWEQVSTAGLDGGPGPSAMRFEGFSRAVGELGLRLEAETGHLRQLAGFATRHAARLAATEHAMITTPADRAPQRSPESDRAAPRRPERGPGMER